MTEMDAVEGTDGRDAARARGMILWPTQQAHHVARLRRCR
jgi:hypothetical protein